MPSLALFSSINVNTIRLQMGNFAIANRSTYRCAQSRCPMTHSDSLCGGQLRRVGCASVHSARMIHIDWAECDTCAKDIPGSKSAHARRHFISIKLQATDKVIYVTWLLASERSNGNAVVSMCEHIAACQTSLHIVLTLSVVFDVRRALLFCSHCERPSKAVPLRRCHECTRALAGGAATATLPLAAADKLK